MRINEPEVIEFMAYANPEWEGKLMYKPPKSGGGFSRSSSEFKERWFKLRGNVLFYWRAPTNPLAVAERPAPGVEPSGMLVLEESHAQREGFSESVHSFSIIFREDNNDEKRHLFIADSARHVEQWLAALNTARYEVLRERLISLQIKLKNRTGRDPLRGTGFENNPSFSSAPSSGRNSGSSSRTDLTAMFAKEQTPSNGSVPKVKPRSKNKLKSTFQSHVVENWERLSGNRYEVNKNEDSSDGKPTFKSHVKVPEGKLIDL